MAESHERKAALEALKQRCWMRAGIRISGQDLRRVAGYKQQDALYKWLNRGRLGKRFQIAIDLPTDDFVAKALHLRGVQRLEADSSGDGMP